MIGMNVSAAEKRLAMNRVIGLCVLLAMLAGAPATIAQDTPPHALHDFIATHRDDLAIVCYDPASPELGVYHNAEARFPLASLLKIAILAAHAQRVAAGAAALDDTFPVSAVDVYYLPGTDSGAYERFVEEIVAGRDELTLDELFGGMIVYSSSAIADFLLSRLDRHSLLNLYRQLDITHTDTPTSQLGLYLAMSNHETGQANPAALTRAMFWKESTRLAQKYVTDQAWREAERDYRARPNRGLPDHAVQEAFLERFGAQGTAAELTRLIAAAYSGDVLDPAAQDIMRRYLDWPLSGASPLDAHFVHFGMKNGAWPGVLSATYYTVDHGGQATALTVLLRHIPSPQWIEWLATFGQLQFELEAIRSRCGVLEQVLAD